MYNPINTLLRYKIITLEYNKHINKSLPDTQIFKRFIQPKFFISMRTMNRVLSMNVDKKLKEEGFTKEQIEKFVEKHNSVLNAENNKAEIGIITNNPYLQPAANNQIF